MVFLVVFLLWTQARWCHVTSNCASPVQSQMSCPKQISFILKGSNSLLKRTSQELVLHKQPLWPGDLFDPGSGKGVHSPKHAVHAGLTGDQSKSFWVWLWVNGVCPVMDCWHVHMSSCLSPSGRWDCPQPPPWPYQWMLAEKGWTFSTRQRSSWDESINKASLFTAQTLRFLSLFARFRHVGEWDSISAKILRELPDINPCSA